MVGAAPSAASRASTRSRETLPRPPVQPRNRRGTKLLAQLRWAKSTGAPLGGIMRRLSELRSLQCRHNHRHDPGARERQARVPAASLNAAEEERAWVRRMCSDLRIDMAAGVRGGREAHSSPSTSRAVGSGGSGEEGGGSDAPAGAPQGGAHCLPRA
ncbi:unnamed protein product, partial [Ectocarpus sp. 12 AP-2014]